MIYQHTYFTEKRSHTMVKNLSEWGEEFFKDLFFKQKEFMNKFKTKPEVCYLGKTEYLNVSEYNRLLIHDVPEKYTTINGVKIVEVFNENYSEFG